jgi:hypothetical protein
MTIRPRDDGPGPRAPRAREPRGRRRAARIGAAEPIPAQTVASTAVHREFAAGPFSPASAVIPAAHSADGKSGSPGLNLLRANEVLDGAVPQAAEPFRASAGRPGRPQNGWPGRPPRPGCQGAPAGRCQHRARQLSRPRAGAGVSLICPDTHAHQARPRGECPFCPLCQSQRATLRLRQVYLRDRHGHLALAHRPDGAACQRRPVMTDRHGLGGGRRGDLVSAKALRISLLQRHMYDRTCCRACVRAPRAKSA